MATKESEFLTPEEIAAFLRVPDRRTRQGKRDFALLLLMLSAGLRKAELCSLRNASLTTYQNALVLEVWGKGNRRRRVPVNADTYSALADYWKAESLNGEADLPMFFTLGRHGPYKRQPLTPKAVDCVVRATAKAALIMKRVTPHTTRHTFAVSLLDAGVDLRTVQALLGHSHIRTTERYLHIAQTTIAQTTSLSTQSSGSSSSRANWVIKVCILLPKPPLWPRPER